MGRGDKKSRKGKVAKGSFGVSRNKKGIKARLKRAASKKVTSAAAKEDKPKKVARKKTEA